MVIDWVQHQVVYPGERVLSDNFGETADDCLLVHYISKSRTGPFANRQTTNICINLDNQLVTLGWLGFSGKQGHICM